MYLVPPCILCTSSAYVISCGVLNKHIKPNMVSEAGVFEATISTNRSKTTPIE